MRRLLLLFALLALAAPAVADAKPTVSIQVSSTRGAAPLQVALTATGDAVSYHWDFGDGSFADGASVSHVFARGGAFHVVVTATGGDGETAEEAVDIAALAVSLRAPRVATYGRRARFRGRIVPAARGVTVALRQGGRIVARARTRADGSYRIRARVRSRTPFEASFEDAASVPAAVVLRPVIRTSLIGSRLVGRPLVLVARVLPAAAGSVQVRLLRDGRERLRRTYHGRVRIRLDTFGARRFDVRFGTKPGEGFAAARSSLRVLVRVPTLSLGASGPGVRLLQQRLVELHFALPGVNGVYGIRTYEAVIAFQKYFGLARTGTVTPGVWTRIQSAPMPHPRYPGGTHIEVDKARQLLFDVIAGELRRIVHVSTGATGNTPLGVWHVYSKLAGFNALSMYYSMFFLRGFAVHGYPEVPAYPASHGCVRTPLWIAPTLYAEHGYGTTIFVYL